MPVFLGKEHKSALLIERYGRSVGVNRYEAAGASAHCGENVLYLKKNCPANLMASVVF